VKVKCVFMAMKLVFGAMRINGQVTTLRKRRSVAKRRQILVAACPTENVNMPADDPVQALTFAPTGGPLYWLNQ